MIVESDSLEELKNLNSESVDLLLTDPPYGISFMGKDWDKALPDKAIWAECLRVLKPGAFAFVMSIPRSDCLSRMIISLEDAGFRTNFTPIYWAYASGFPKAQNIGKAVDKRLGTEREVTGRDKSFGRHDSGIYELNQQGLEPQNEWNKYDNPSTPQAKALDGSYGGFQPKPAVEVIIVCMKPLSEKTFVDQALKNQKGITWLDDCRVPYERNESPETVTRKPSILKKDAISYVRQDEPLFGGTGHISGRFPANLLVSDDVLNDGRILTSPSHRTYGNRVENQWTKNPISDCRTEPADSGSFSRYFDLDKWAQKTFPFLIVPKASKSEKNKGCEDLPEKEWGQDSLSAGIDRRNTSNENPAKLTKYKPRNNHPTVKPLKLMSYLITLGSREGDTVLDPFIGSGTTAVACKMLKRNCIGIDISKEYCEIANKRVEAVAACLL